MEYIFVFAALITIFKAHSLPPYFTTRLGTPREKKKEIITTKQKDTTIVNSQLHHPLLLYSFPLMEAHSINPQEKGRARRSAMQRESPEILSAAPRVPCYPTPTPRQRRTTKKSWSCHCHCRCHHRPPRWTTRRQSALPWVPSHLHHSQSHRC
jgi:hypothetical protein